MANKLKTTSFREYLDKQNGKSGTVSASAVNRDLKRSSCVSWSKISAWSKVTQEQLLEKCRAK